MPQNVESLHLKRKTRVPFTSEAIKYKAQKHAKLQAMQHHFTPAQVGVYI
jgi:hypothetical protein